MTRAGEFVESKLPWRTRNLSFIWAGLSVGATGYSHQPLVLNAPSHHTIIFICALWGSPTLSILCPRQMPRFGIDGAEQELTDQESAPRTPPPSTLASAASSLVPKAPILVELKLLW